MTDMIAPNIEAPLFIAKHTRLTTHDTRVENRSGEKIDPKIMRRIDQSAKEFEAVFLSEMLKPMFEGIEVNDIFGGGKGEEIFSDMMVQEYGKKMSEAGGIGLASFVRNELIRQQEGSIKS